MGDVNKTLAEWQQRTDAATELPWTPFTSPGDRETAPYAFVETETDRWVRIEGPMEASFLDALFIATAREAMPKLLAALRAIEALCDDPYMVEFIEAPEDGVLVSDIRQALNDALLASEPSGSEEKFSATLFECAGVEESDE